MKISHESMADKAPASSVQCPAPFSCDDSNMLKIDDGRLEQFRWWSQTAHCSGIRCQWKERDRRDGSD